MYPGLYYFRSVVCPKQQFCKLSPCSTLMDCLIRALIELNWTQLNWNHSTDWNCDYKADFENKICQCTYTRMYTHSVSVLCWHSIQQWRPFLKFLHSCENATVLQTLCKIASIRPLNCSQLYMASAKGKCMSATYCLFIQVGSFSIVLYWNECHTGKLSK